MYNAPLYNRLVQFAKSHPARFFMPGHKGGQGMGDCFLAPVMPFDVTELSSTGNLYSEMGIIEEAHDLCAADFGAKCARFCTGGSTQGIHGALFLAAKRGRHILLDRGVHGSVVNGCILYGLQPDYIQSDLLTPFGVAGDFDLGEIEKALKKTQYCAFVVTSPTYYGVVRDIAALVALCEKYNTLLIVDGAHGAHLGFHPKLPQPAQRLGAHFTIASAHKTLGALTQGAYFFSNCREFSKEEIIEALSLTGTASPSYLVMASLDWARAYLVEEGKARLDWLLLQNNRVRQAVAGTDVLLTLTEGACCGAGFDDSRLVIYCGNTQISGYELYGKLERIGVVCEMADETQVVALPSIHSKAEDFERLIEAVEAIPWRFKQDKVELSAPFPLPRQALSPREAAMAPREKISILQSEGRICAQKLSKFPPGIPFLVPGEMIEKEVFSYLKTHVTGDIFVVK